MKTLFLIRHAKSSWSDAGMDDFDRPLNERGRADAPMMARRLLKKGVNLNLLVSSPAKRAKTTCLAFAEILQLKQKQILIKEELYLAAPDIYETVIAQLSDEDEHAAIFAHNPGITDFANSLTDVRIDNMPTCSVFAIKIDVKHWRKWKAAPKEFWFFDYPKKENN